MSMVQPESVSRWVTAIYRRMLTCQDSWINVGKSRRIFLFLSTETPWQNNRMSS
jgi:hypothetical protein